MNSIFKQYVSKVGKMYAECSVLETRPLSCILAGKVHTFHVTKFIYKTEELRFFKCGKVGFLSVEVRDVPKSFLQSHREVIENIGTVRDLFNFSNEYMQNISDAFLCEVPEKNMQLLVEDLAGKCKENPMDIPFAPTVQLQDLTMFAYEANGNVFLYDHAGKLFLYASDHCYTNVTSVDGYPEFTLYHIQDMQTFDDFIRIFCSNFNI